MATAVTHVVLRALPGPGGRIYQPKERLDFSGIDPERLRALEGRRFVRPVTVADLEAASPEAPQDVDDAAPKRGARKGR
jgi:hypothetical protein